MIHIRTTLLYLVLIVGTVLLSALNSSAQELPFTFEKKGLFKQKTAIKMCGFELTQQQLVVFMADDPNMDEYSKPLAGMFLSKSILGATGSVLSTWPLLQLQLDQEPNLNLTYAGLATLAVSTVIDHVFSKKAVKAATFYNNGYQEPQIRARYQIKPASSGVGIALAF
ncbi:hypothetical protein [Marinoscillum sp.]|uniref:hypothetical protein n=1 Tax=Marinoscillum sp. TaxID=2024838 RepID=UPI003BAC88B4